MFALSGCVGVGPKSISMGRASYNEAINRTDDEQMLLAIVKSRYGETFSLLSVSGVAANVRFRTNTGIQAGFGPDRNYDGNLVPFSGGFVYEENPTITYAPVHGEKYIRQLLSPIPLDLLVLSIRNATRSADYVTAFANRINDMRNPDFLHADSKPDPRFERFVALGGELGQAGVLQWAADAKEDVDFVILISGYAPDWSEMVHEYLSLLGFPMPRDETKDIVIPVYFGVRGQKLEGIAISTRSTFDLLEIMQASIEIPQEHSNAGLSRTYPAPGLAGKDLHIHASKVKPEQPAIAVRHRGYWFFIDDADMRTKLFYTILKGFWSVSISSAANQSAAPVLTIPIN